MYSVLLALSLALFSTVLAERSSENDIIVDVTRNRRGISRFEPKVEDNRTKRQALILGANEYSKQWPNGKVHYYFSEEFDPRVKGAITLAMQQISNNTCISFTTKPAEVMIKMISENKGGCSSVIGRRQQDQPFVFDADCWSAGMAVHELIHALGFCHAHQRLDRDEYLEVVDLEQYEGTRMEDQYRIFENQVIYVPYDYGSVMQYPGDEFVPLTYRYYETMGSEVVAYYDYLMINKFYNCYCKEADISVTCKNYGYPNPADCSKCNCPLGYGGKDCSERPEPGASLEAGKDWKSLNVTLDAGFKDNDGEKDRQIDYIYHYLWISAPANKTIEIKMNNLSGLDCKQGCRAGGYEVKNSVDPRLTSPRQCCEDHHIWRSKNNPTIVMFFNSEGLDEYEMAYRFIDNR